MSNISELQRQILAELLDYSDKIIPGTEQVIEELRGSLKSDTEELFNLVVQGINWEIEVFNNCEPLINKDAVHVDKTKMAKAVVRLGKILQERDDIKMAACLDVDFLPFLKEMKAVSAAILA